MRLFIVTLLVTSSLWAYQTGEKVSGEVAKKLQLQPEGVYIIDFFASWCISCKHELPLIEKLRNEIDNRKVEIIGVDVDEVVAKGVAFQKALGLGFRIINDSKAEIIKKFEPVGMPAIYIVKDLKVQKIILGAKDNIDKLLLKSLEEVE